VPEAVARTVRGAGRTVVFSGITVAASLSVLLAFPFPFLSSFAYAGVAVVLAAVSGATVLLPAALALLGRRVERRGPVRPETAGFWFTTATRVMRRPLLPGGATLAVLLLLGSPFLGVRFGLPDDRGLPASAPARQMYDQIRDGFTAEESDAVQVVAPAGNDGSVGAYAAELSGIEGVVRVDSAAGSWRSAPLVTAAAILAVSFAGYATGDVVFLKQLGVGMALAVIVDATLIRGVLVPAFMRLAGRGNWWAPGPLRHLHHRIGLAERPAPDPATAPPATAHSATAAPAPGPAPVE
jgi:uncharacterized membrane protein YdfJ with MMPL/SSD domain